MTRLLSVNNYNYRRGGSDVVFLAHDELFARRGWETAVMAMKHPKNLQSPWSDYFVDEIEYEGSHSIWERLQQIPKIIWSNEAIRKADRLLDGFKADVVHAHCIYHHLSPSVLYAAKRRDIPTVMTQHDLKLACPAYKMLNDTGVCERCRSGNLLHLVANRCIRGSSAASAVVMVESAVHRSFGVYRKYLDRMIAPSRFYVEKLIEWGWERERLRYVPNYVQSEHLVPQFQPGKYLLYFGRLAPEKGVGTLMRAANEAGLPLVIAGTGPIEVELKKRAAASGAEVSFVGYKSGGELHDLVRGARAVVLPSEWYENAPMSVLESFALGKIVIGARIGGIPELIEDGHTGATFASGNVDDLVRALREVADAKDSAIRDMGRAARAYVSDTFTERRYFDEISAVYAELGVRTPETVVA